MGTFYTVLSRFTTLGDPKDKMMSSICFTGPNFDSAKRFMNIRNKANTNNKYESVEQRDKWNKYLQQNQRKKENFLTKTYKKHSIESKQQNSQQKI